MAGALMLLPPMASVFVRALPVQKPSSSLSPPSLALRSRRKVVVPIIQTPGDLFPFRNSSSSIRYQRLRIRCTDSPGNSQGEEVEDLGVRVALSMLRFYKSEISPILPSSCRYVPTCSEYSMEAYKKYGVVRGTILTAWRLCRCNPLGGSGFDPPRWFDEQTPTKK